MTPEREARLRAAAADALDMFQPKAQVRRPGAKSRRRKDEDDEQLD